MPSDDGTSNTAFVDLNETDYPFRLEFLDRKGVVVWSTDVAEPGAVRIPALGQVYGPVTGRITFPGGEVWSSDAEPPRDPQA